MELSLSHRALRITLILLVLFLAARCGQATPAGEPLLVLENTVLADDFSRPDANWVRFDTDTASAYVLAGEFYLEDGGQRNAVYAPLLRNNFVDVTIDVRVRHVQGSVDNWMGVICRQVDEENYYLFAISADGYYVILEVSDGVSVPLTGPKYSENLNRGKAENTLRVRCWGTTLSFWANDALLVTTNAESLNKAGGVAMFVDAVRAGEVTVVAFDDFILASP